METIKLKEMIHLRILIVLLAHTAFSQETYLNTFYVEALGTGGLLSVNYQRQLSANLPLNAHIGLGYVPEIFEPASLTLPYGINYSVAIAEKWRL